MTVDTVLTPERTSQPMTPERSLEQRRGALEQANAIRIRRAQFKRDIKAGRLKAIDYILDPPDWLCTMKVWDILLAMPKMGRVKVGNLMKQVHISQSKTVSGLSPRQRSELVVLLRGR